MEEGNHIVKAILTLLVVAVVLVFFVWPLIGPPIKAFGNDMMGVFFTEFNADTTGKYITLDKVSHVGGDNEAIAPVQPKGSWIGIGPHIGKVAVPPETYAKVELSLEFNAEVKAEMVSQALEVYMENCDCTAGQQSDECKNSVPTKQSDYSEVYGSGVNSAGLVFSPGSGCSKTVTVAINVPECDINKNTGTISYLFIFGDKLTGKNADFDCDTTKKMPLSTNTVMFGFN